MAFIGIVLWVCVFCVLVTCVMTYRLIKAQQIERESITKLLLEVKELESTLGLFRICTQDDTREDRSLMRACTAIIMNELRGAEDFKHTDPKGLN